MIEGVFIYFLKSSSDDPHSDPIGLPRGVYVPSSDSSPITTLGAFNFLHNKEGSMISGGSLCCHPDR